MQTFNLVLFIIAVIAGVLGFFLGLYSGGSLFLSFMFAVGVFATIYVGFYLAVLIGAGILAFAVYVLSKIAVLFILAAMFGVIGGIFKIFGI